MPATQQGSFRLFRLLGIDVFLHWSWFLVAVYEIQGRQRNYTSILWNVIEYLALFLIVLLHEFGHALACRSTGGKADRIMLWPLGGVAYVDPPPRPGASLWSVAAGPLVNVVLMPLLLGAFFWARSLGWPETLPNLYWLLRSVLSINVVLLVFNLLPIYPLDGGQILRSLLWFFLGRARSLMAASILGIVGVLAIVATVWFTRSIWSILIAVFMGSRCWQSIQQARLLRKLEKMPRPPGFACPNCQAPPPIGPYWLCEHCQQPFDTFATAAQCPLCGQRFDGTTCGACFKMAHIEDWALPHQHPPIHVLKSEIPAE